MLEGHRRRSLAPPARGACSCLVRDRLHRGGAMMTPGRAHSTSRGWPCTTCWG